MNTKVLSCVIAALLVGCTPSTPTKQVTISFAWAYRAGDYIRGTPAVNGQVVYVGSDDNNLLAVNTETGQLVWKYETAGNITSAPAFAGDTVYFGSSRLCPFTLNSRRPVEVFAAMPMELAAGRRWRTTCRI